MRLLNKKTIKKAHVALSLFFFYGICYGSDPLSKDYYETDKTIKSYLESIDKKFDAGLEHADDLKGEISKIKSDQVELDKGQIVHEYELRIIKAEQGIITTRVGLLEERGEEQKKINTHLVEGMKRSLDFVESVTGAGGFVIGIIGTIIAGVIVNFIRKKTKGNR
jgi:hypothetical protein